MATGRRVTRFRKGDKVVTLFNQGHIAGPLNSKTKATGLGGVLDGTLRGHGIFNEEGLVPMPASLSYLEASTLPCAALTAWNALFGLNPLQPGQVVLTQGTGGVSLFAVQFAKAAGATVIATTSSSQKEKILKDLGADRVINYKQVPNWGDAAKEVTKDREGVDNVVEVGGDKTMEQSIKAVKVEGLISIVGYVASGSGKGQEAPSWLECLARTFNVRGLFVGSRAQQEDMVSLL